MKEGTSLDASAEKRRKKKKKQLYVFERLRKICRSGSRQQHKEIPKMIQLLYKDSTIDRSCLALNELVFNAKSVVVAVGRHRYGQKLERVIICTLNFNIPSNQSLPLTVCIRSLDFFKDF